MNFLNKLERKYGKYAIHNLMYYIIILYGIGTVLDIVAPGLYLQYLALDVRAVLHGQVWRLLTFLIQAPSGGLLFAIIALYLYYMIGTNLENQWGAFRFNMYFFVGVLGHILAAFLVYFINGDSVYINIYYLNFSLFFAFAATYPNMQFLLFFVIPVKAKWLAWLNGAFFAYEFLIGSFSTKICIALSMANFLIFFFATRNFKRISPQEIHRKQAYKKATSRPQGITKHKCAICGRTEEDGDELEFRFCSKCDGNYEYCQDHLFTHTHIKR
ncbi:rhomboid family intramembrane serine protease [Konateibacter massiliensis]|uniref:rhomboid family intramembrane serine protease n=1 Tax=Konateibacter massiliensis TaxID=2002841 RepID=UPI000C15F60C|nr:hypothetical protein [Konateibacter massiliensis]